MLGTATVAIQGVTLLLLLGASAFFSLSETAMIAVKRPQVRALAAQGDARAKRLDRMLDQPERILSTVLVGNNLINISAASFATVSAVALWPDRGALIASIGMTALVILFGEILPKTISVRKPLPLALAVAAPLRVVETVLSPLVGAAAWLGTSFARLVGVKAEGKAPYLSQEEIQMIVEEGVESGEVERFEARVITELFDFTETDVHRIMTPISRVVHVREKATLADVVQLAAKEGRTRIPVIRGDLDHILGFVHIKDLLRYTDLELGRLPATSSLRPCLFATADTPADKLLVRMQREHTLLAVIQEGGNNIGIVTAEDLLEELVGELHDEVDRAKGRIVPPAPANG